MWTVVLLASAVLAASATPIETFLDSSFEESQDPHEEDAHASDVHADSTLVNQNGGGNDVEQPQDTINSTVHEEGSHGEEHESNESSGGSGGGNTNNHDGNDSNSLNHSVSATSSEATTEDNTPNKSEEPSPTNDGLPVSPEDNTVNNGGDTPPTPSVSTSSVTSTKPETPTQQSNESVSTPGDADPTDCKNATQKNHTYVMCTFSCQGDELFTAPDNSSCYLYPPNVTNDIIIAEEYNHAEHKVMGIGVCFRGDCVRNLSTVPEATTESSPADDSTQQRTESYTTPSDDDPTDCKNASKTNHTYVMCTFSCQGDEVFTAPDNSSCYLYPPNVTYEILIAEEYNHTQHTVMGTGFCFQGNCVRNLSMVSVAPTESSPGTTATATTSTTTATTTTASAAETGGERESATVQTSDDSERSPQPSPPEDTPSETPNSSPEKPLPKVASAEKEGASTTTTKGPLGLPGALP